MEIIAHRLATTVFPDETYSVGVDHALDGVHERLRVAFIVNGRLRSWNDQRTVTSERRCLRE